MRIPIKKFVKMVADTIPLQEPIYEFGAFQVEHQRELANLRLLFPGKKFIGADMRAGHGVDIILNLHDIKLSSNSVGTVLCAETIEHVEYPRRALSEIYRILKPSGLVVMTSGMNQKIHNHPNDYWRFTPEGFRSLLQDFQDTFVGDVGNPLFPSIVIGIASKGSSLDIDGFKSVFKDWQSKALKNWRKKQGSNPNDYFRTLAKDGGN